MSDLDRLRVLTEQVRPPAFASLQDTARRRDRHTAATAFVGAALVALLVVGVALSTRSQDRSIEPVEPDPDRTQTEVNADYGEESIYRFEAHQVSNTGEHAGETDLSVDAGWYEGSTIAYWCSGDPGVSYLVQVTGGSDDPDHVGVWRAGGACDGLRADHGDGYSGTGPPPGPTDSIGSQLTRFSPVPADEDNPTTVRVVLTDRIPGSIMSAYCFDLPGGPIPEECQDESSVDVLDSAGTVDFGAVIFTRPVEYVATVAGVPVQAQAFHEGTEWLFARGVESMPGTDKVTLESSEPGFVYVVQSDPQGAAECQQAFEKAKARGDEFLYEGDMDGWDCTMKEAELRLLVDGQPVTKANQFPSSGSFQGWFGLDAAQLDAGHHDITVERIDGAARVIFGLVLFEEQP
jgi:hypothetical protein